jgi:hypothetical protein
MVAVNRLLLVGATAGLAALLTEYNELWHTSHIGVREATTTATKEVTKEVTKEESFLCY